MKTDRLYLFVHLHKCAGSSLNHHLKKNFPSSAVLNVFAGPKSYGYHHFYPQEFRKISQKFCQDLPLKKRQVLQFICGHKVPAGFGNQLETGKEPFYFTILRDPAQRVVSLYNYYRGWYERELPLKKDKKIYQDRFLIDGRCPDFIIWFEDKFLKSEDVFTLHTMTEYFQQLDYLQAGDVTESKIKQALDKFDFIGFTKTFSSDSLYLYHLWNIDKFFTRRNVSTKYFQLEKDSKLAKRVKAALSDDYLFYQLAQEYKEVWLKKHPEYQQIVKKMKEKKATHSWQQWVYDWPANFHFFSKWLRKQCPIYGKGLDQIKTWKTKALDRF